METLKNYSKFMGLSYLLAVILLCIASVILAYTNVSDNMLLTFVFVIVVITTLIGSTLLARKVKKRGLIYGLIFGLIYFLVVYLISVIFYNGFVFNNTVAMYLLMCTVSGIIGGIIGVNI